MMLVAFSLLLAASAQTALAETCTDSIGYQYSCNNHNNLSTPARIIIGIGVAVGCLLLIIPLVAIYLRRRRRHNNLVYIHQPYNPPPTFPSPQTGSPPYESIYGGVNTQEQSGYHNNSGSVTYPPKAHATQPYSPPPYPPA